MTAPNETENVEDQNLEETETEETDDNGSEEEGQPSYEDLKKALDKANRERTAAQRKYKELRDSSKDKSDPPALSDAAKRVLVVTALKAEGLDASQASKLAKLYELENVDVDGDDVIGIDFTELKEDFPQLFTKDSPSTGTKPSPGRKIDKGDKRNERQADPSESFANALMRK